MPVRNRHGIKNISANEEVDMTEFTSVIVYATGAGGNYQVQSGVGGLWRTLGSYGGASSGTAIGEATAFPAATNVRCTANVVAIEGIREIAG